MNRREFTKGLAAMGAAPLLPVPSLGAAAPASGAVAMSAAAESMYFWGWFTARVHKTCSPETLSRLLKLDGDVAAEICERLVREGAITAPDAFGVSRAVDPLYEKFTTMKQEVVERMATRNAQANATDQTRPKNPAKQAVDDDLAVDDDPQEDAETAENAPLPAVNHDGATLTDERDSTTHSPGAYPDDPD